MRGPLTLGVTAVYVVAFLALPAAMSPACATVIVPVIAAGLCYGTKGGAAAGVLSIALNMLLFGMTGGGFLQPVTGAVTVASLTAIPVGMTVGGLSDMVLRYRGMEAAFHAGEARYRDLLDSMDDPVTVGAAGKRLFVNDAFVDLFALESKEAALSLVPFAVPPDYTVSASDTARVRASLARVEQDRQSADQVEYALSRNGEPRFLDLHSSPIDYEGTAAVLTVARDVTAQRQAEGAVRDSEAKFHAVFDHAGMGIATLSRDGRFLDANPALQHLLGYSREEMHAIGWQQITFEDDFDASAEGFRSILNGRTGFETEKRFRRADGSLLWTRLTTSAMRSPIGEVEFFVAMVEDLSEQANAMEALRESEELYRIVNETNPDAVVVYADNERLLVNQAYVDLYEFKDKEEALAELASCAADRAHPDDRVGLLEFWDAYEHGEKVQQPFAYRTIKKNGEVRHVEMVGSAVRFQGRLAAYAAVRDVTARKRAAIALRESEERYRAVVETMSDSVVVAAAGRRRMLNQAYVTTMGYSSQEDALSEFCGSGIVAADYARVMRFASDVREGLRPPGRIEYDVETPDGSTRRIEAAITAVPYEGEAAELSVLRDVTEARRVMDALRESEERYRAVVETMAEPVIVSVGDKRLFVNQAYLHLYGDKDEQEALDQPRLLGIDEADQTRVARRLMEVEQGLTPVAAIEFKRSTPDGRTLDVQASAVSVLYEGKAAVLAVHRDMTERNELERAKSEFVSTVSHELRTPLTSLHASLSLLESGMVEVASDEGRHLVSIAARNTQRLADLVNNVLKVERLGSGMVKLGTSELSATALIETAVDEMRQMAVEKDVTLDVAAAGVSVEADEPRIIELIVNLLSNAIRFSPPGSTVGVGAVQIEGPEALFWVADSGRGVPLDERQRIFERFYQIEGQDAGDDVGSGLGLAICRAIVEQHGGRIWVEDTEGSGATFKFALPIAGGERNIGSPEDARAEDAFVAEDATGRRTATGNR